MIILWHKKCIECGDYVKIYDDRDTEGNEHCEMCDSCWIVVHQSEQHEELIQNEGWKNEVTI